MAYDKVILCIDDDPDDLYLIRQTLAQIAPNAKVLEAANGLQGWLLLEKAKESRHLPCIILLDINMPVMNGRETLEKINADEDLKTVPVVVFTSSANPADKAFCSSCGVPMVTKPYDYKMMTPLLQPLVQPSCHTNNFQ